MSKEAVAFTTTSERSASYRSYLKWFYFLLRIIGINLNTGEKRSIWWSLAFLFYAWLLLWANASSCALRIVSSLSLANGTHDWFKTKTGSLNLHILRGVDTIQCIGAHLALVLIISRRWNQLWKSILRMERQLEPDGQSYKHFSYLVKAGMIYIGLVSTNLTALINRCLAIMFQCRGCSTRFISW